ncbi:MAG TPA: pseudouridine synthase [Candidatus Limnocylindria bacterium]|nr:pseudouridine synthase [Candidatus Limnocylindria bacterium]
MSERVRIGKALAAAGVASRRASDALVAAGRVTVNDRPAALGETVDPAVDRLAVDGRVVERPARRVYLLAAKPAGVTSTVSDRHAARTVIELVPAGLRAQARRLYPVGRLDRDSEGLLLLTNDGDWAQRLLHPSHAVEREYAIGLARPLSADQRARLLGGVELDEGIARLAALAPATAADRRRLSRLIGAAAGPLVWYRATLRQGWKRQLRRMFAAVGQPVQRLVRLRFGSLRLGDLALGEVRPLTGAERRQLDALGGRRRG